MDQLLSRAGDGRPAAVRGRRSLAAAAVAAALALPGAAAGPEDGGRFLREDWTLSVEPTHLDHWGTRFAYGNLPLLGRGMQRGKHLLETRYADNWRFGGAGGGTGGVVARVFFGTFLDFGLQMGAYNIHHVTGHDAAAREFDREHGGRRHVPLRLKQILPTFLGGRPLGTHERQPPGRGADANTTAMVEPMESENTHAYEEARRLLGAERVNATAAQRFLFYRMRFMLDWTETGTLDQAFIDSQQPGVSSNRRVGGEGLSTDFTWYLHYLNRNRYGVTRVDDYRLTMGDVKGAFYLQMADPVLWSALYAYGRDYLRDARNTTSLPMFRVGAHVRYLPGLRIFFSPFGIEYFQDNHLRRRDVLGNVYWTVGDNRYETRYGGGFDADGIPLPRGVRLGIHAALIHQPLLSRLTDPSALGPESVGRHHLAYNVGGSVRVPLKAFDEGADPRDIHVFARVGRKNLSWFPGEYLGAGLYAQLGVGLRL